MLNLNLPGRRPGPIVLYLAVALATAGGYISLAAAGPIPAKSTPAPMPIVEIKPLESEQLRILAPAEGNLVAPGKTLVIGRMPEGSDRVDLSINGSSAGQATTDRNAFFLTVTLSPGRNTIIARSGNKEQVYMVTGDAKPLYVWHPGVEKCSGCHLASEKGFKVSGPKDKVCYRCHQHKDHRKFVHGPLGAGECTACHDPHGSSGKSLTLGEPLIMCAFCHDQKSSEQHLRNSKGKPCIQCHDPHASDKPNHLK